MSDILDLLSQVESLEATVKDQAIFNADYVVEINRVNRVMQEQAEEIAEYKSRLMEVRGLIRPIIGNAPEILNQATIEEPIIHDKGKTDKTKTQEEWIKGRDPNQYGGG